MRDPNDPSSDYDDTGKQPIAKLPSANDSGSKPLSSNQFGLNDSHLGPTNEYGVRPVNDDGYNQIMQSVKQSSQPTAQIPLIGQQQAQQGQGIIGGMFNNAINQGVSNSAIGQSLQKGLSGGITSILNFL